MQHLVAYMSNSVIRVDFSCMGGDVCRGTNNISRKTQGENGKGGDVAVSDQQ